MRNESGSNGGLEARIGNLEIRDPTNLEVEKMMSRIAIVTERDEEGKIKGIEHQDKIVPPNETYTRVLISDRYNISGNNSNYFWQNPSDGNIVPNLYHLYGHVFGNLLTPAWSYSETNVAKSKGIINNLKELVDEQMLSIDENPSEGSDYYGLDLSVAAKDLRRTRSILSSLLETDGENYVQRLSKFIFGVTKEDDEGNNVRVMKGVAQQLKDKYFNQRRIYVDSLSDEQKVNLPSHQPAQ
jgi:hypothetical protein